MDDTLRYNGRSYLCTDPHNLLLRCPDCGRSESTHVVKYLQLKERWKQECSHCAQILFPIVDAMEEIWERCDDVWEGCAHLMPLFKQYRIKGPLLMAVPFFTLRQGLRLTDPNLYAIAWDPLLPIPTMSEELGLVRVLKESDVEVAYQEVDKRQRKFQFTARRNEPDTPHTAAKHLQNRLIHGGIVARSSYTTMVELSRRKQANLEDPTIGPLESTLRGSTEKPGALPFDIEILDDAVRRAFADCMHVSAFVEQRLSG